MLKLKLSLLIAPMLFNQLNINDLIVEESYEVVEDYSKASEEEIFREMKIKTDEVSEEKINEYLIQNMKSKTDLNKSFDRFIELKPKSFKPPALPGQYITYMPINAITSKSSRQYKFIETGLIETDQDGFNKVNDAYCVALGSHYDTEVGNVYMINFDNGQFVEVVITDLKADIHTDSTNRYSDFNLNFDGINGNILEIVFNDTAYNHLSYSDKVRTINKIINDKFPGKITNITLIGKYNF